LKNLKHGRKENDRTFNCSTLCSVLVHMDYLRPYGTKGFIMIAVCIFGTIFAVYYIMSLASYYHNMTNAEDIWQEQNGEIPDGYCLVYSRNRCHLEKVE
jgi:hypothetical protein